MARASLLVAQVDLPRDPLAAARVTLAGRAERVTDPSRLAVVRVAYLSMVRAGEAYVGRAARDRPGARRYPDATAARCNGLDRRGIDLAVQTPRGRAVTRVAFPEVLVDGSQPRAATVGLTRQARAIR